MIDDAHYFTGHGHDGHGHGGGADGGEEAGPFWVAGLISLPW